MGPIAVFVCSRFPDDCVLTVGEMYSCLCDRRQTVSQRIDNDEWEKQNDILQFPQIKTLVCSDIVISLQSFSSQLFSLQV